MKIPPWQEFKMDITGKYEAPVGKLGALGRTDKATWHTLGLASGKALEKDGKGCFSIFRQGAC